MLLDLAVIAQTFLLQDGMPYVYTPAKGKLYMHRMVRHMSTRQLKVSYTCIDGTPYVYTPAKGKLYMHKPNW